MQIYNSLGRHKEELIPVHPGNIRIYVCGITAYDYCHIGHARAAVTFDTLVRHLRLSGLETLYIQNFTDIDDKIINRANKEGRDWREVGETYIKAFHEDMAKLGVNGADLQPRATDYIPQIQEICKKLIEKKLAYATSRGDVYFRARKWKPYGKLSGRNIDDLIAGARVAPGEEKEDPLDFALWKSAKSGEPSWPSPWGDGRPGWHIECSAMTQPHLPLDIHGGGLDLIFPHHENEIAQSEAAFETDLAKYWVHNGFVRIDSEKMSKSLGNFKTIREILKDWLPETLRYFLLSKHYRSPLDFTVTGMQEAEKALQRVYTSLRDAAKALEHQNWKKVPLPESLLKEWQSLPEQFAQALDDDLNTAQAIGIVFNTVRIINRILEDKKLRQSQDAGVLLDEFIARSATWNSELGLFGEHPEKFLNELRNIKIKRMNLDLTQINELLNKRKIARESKDFSLSDQLRNELEKLGVVCKDTPNGQEWDLI